jgi:hypothetical protein
MLTNKALVNQCFAAIDALEEVQRARCVVLHRQPELIGSATRFPWWPHRLRRRRGPRQK